MNLKNANRLELHYYFNDDSHEIDALVRNKCESELLAIIIEVAAILDIDSQLISEVYQQGGFRDFWKILGKNVQEVTLLLMFIQTIVTTIPQFEGKNEELEEELSHLNIEEKKLSIEKLKRELRDNETTKESIKKTADTVANNLRIIKRKSNFYSNLEKHEKINKIGFSALNDNWNPVTNEISVVRTDFRKFILSTNKLRSEEDDNAIIEIVSPVLKEGRYKWKGIYNETPISFDMQDVAFRDAVLLENIPFQHGSVIKCVLIIHREIDEIGEVKITGYSVTTVFEKIDGNASFQTTQGKKYRHAKKLMEAQTDIFPNN